MESRRDELANPAISTIGEHATVTTGQCLDVGSSVVNGIVSIAWATTRDGDDAQVAAADEDLGVARPPVVLGLCRDVMIARRDKRSVDDPGATSVEIDNVTKQRCKPPHDVGDDAMGLRARDGEHRGELAQGEVRAKARAPDHDAAFERQRPRTATSRGLPESVHDIGERTRRQAGEHRRGVGHVERDVTGARYDQVWRRGVSGSGHAGRTRPRRGSAVPRTASR